MGAVMQAEFYHRHHERLSDQNLRTLVADDLARRGFITDKLKNIEANRYGTSYWHYVIPVQRVTA